MLIRYEVNFGSAVLDYEVGGAILADEIPTAAVPQPRFEQDLQFTTDTKRIMVSINTETAPPGSFGAWGATSPNYTGSRALFNNLDGGITVIRSFSSLGNILPNNSTYASTIDTYSTFDFASIDISELTNQSSYIPTSVVFMAEKLNGDIVTSTVYLDGTFGIETFTFGNVFNDVSRVWWSQTPEWHQFDNIVLNNMFVATVPLPPALWLFGSSLLGLIGMARRKKAA